MFLGSLTIFPNKTDSDLHAKKKKYFIDQWQAHVGVEVNSVTMASHRGQDFTAAEAVVVTPGSDGGEELSQRTNG